VAEFFVDLSAASNGSGTEGSPFNSFASINSGGWVRGDVVRVKRGSHRVVNAGTRANIVCTSGSGRLLVTAYGDESLPLPVIDGGSSTFNPVWVQSGSGVDIEKLHVTNTPADGFSITPTNGNTLDDIELRDCLATRTGLNGLLGVDGFKFGLANQDGGAVTNIRGKRLVARDCGGHGIKVRGMVTGATIEDSIALRCGWASPSHGMGTAGGFVIADGGWSNVSGNIWQRSLSAPLLTDFSAWFEVLVVGAAPIYRLTPAVNPLLPATGEFGNNGPNTLRINLGALDPNSMSSIFAIYARPDSVWFRNCVAMHTIDFNGIEGQGLYFDNGSIRCWSMGCVSAYNDGQGQYLNDCTDSGHYAGFNFSNKRGGAGIVRGLRTNHHGNVYVCEPGTPGLAYSAGNASAKARMNTIVGASVGIQTNDVGTNTVDEDENVFVSCATRLLNVSGPGARSRDEANAKPFAARSTWTALRAALAAEQVN
jgi:hypothetical protein